METGTIIVIIIAVLIALFALYWMRGRGEQVTGGGRTDVPGDQGTDIRAPGSSTFGDTEPERSGDWASIDETERGLGEREEPERGEDQLPRV